MVLGVSILSVCLLRKLGLPSVVGYLASGFLFGPYMLGLVDDAGSMRSMAEIGLVFLLFTTGLKFSLHELAKLRVLVFAAGGGQVVVTLAVTTAICVTLGLRPAESLVVGFVVALSSTALVAKLLEERGEVDAPHGRVGMSILLAQDLAVVPMLVVLPALSGAGGSWGQTTLQLAKPIALLIAILVASLYVVPRVLRRVVATRNREILNLSIVGIAVGTAFVTGEVGVPLELGAFLAGVIVSESEYADHVLAEIAPLRDVFSGLFFVSIGMLVDPGLWQERPAALAGGVLAVVLGKAVVVGALALAFGFGLKAALIAGFGLAQMGEFSYVLAQSATERGLLTESTHGAVVSVAAVTMAATPLLFAGAARATERLDKRRLPVWLRGDRRWPTAGLDDGSEAAALSDHVILVGYGPSGRNVAQALEAVGVAFVALELNPLTVMAAQREGRDVRYGDAGRAETLEGAGLATARALVISTSDPTASRLVTSVARQHRDDLFIVARTRFVSEVDELHALGADAVASEEFETSIAIAGMLLPAYGCAPASVERQQRALREGHYAPFRGRAGGPKLLRDLLAHVQLDEITLAEGAGAVGLDLATLDLRRATGAMVVAIERDGAVMLAPSPSIRLEAYDRLFLTGDAAALSRAQDSLASRAPEDAGA